MARNSSRGIQDYIINGVDQRSIPEQRRAEQELKDKLQREYERYLAAQKKSQAKRLDRIMGANNPQSPSPSDISNGKLRNKNK